VQNGWDFQVLSFRPRDECREEFQEKGVLESLVYYLHDFLDPSDYDSMTPWTLL